MVIADTGFFLAVANRKDSFHKRAVERASTLKGPVYTSTPVITETTHLLRNFVSNKASLSFIQSVANGAFVVYELMQDDYKRAYALMKKYKDLPMDLADASLIILAEHLDTGDILTSDRRDFTTYRWSGRRTFCNLLLD